LREGQPRPIPLACQAAQGMWAYIMVSSQLNYEQELRRGCSPLSIEIGLDFPLGRQITEMKKPRRLSVDVRHALNAICPYFTMFPLEFPLRILHRYRNIQIALDPFCGRGTTLYAGRYRGIRSIGIDCSPVAVAISRAKLASFSVSAPMAVAEALLSHCTKLEVPEGEFWELAYHPDTLAELCRLRAGLLHAEDSDACVLLRATVLGVLHGPFTKAGSYLSNQMQRTFSPKPDYAVRYWRKRGLLPTRIDVRSAVRRKLERIAQGTYDFVGEGWRDVHQGDSSSIDTFCAVPEGIDLVVTSPPYYGMRTYVADQWLRHWFLGGPSKVDYKALGALPSSSPEDFTKSLARTWANTASKRADILHLFVRFGAIPSRLINAKQLLLESLEESGLSWRVLSVRGASTAEAGKRQVEQMRTHAAPITEFDLHALLM
jgi:hypothetical protein